MPHKDTWNQACDQIQITVIAISENNQHSFFLAE